MSLIALAGWFLKIKPQQDYIDFVQETIKESFHNEAIMKVLRESSKIELEQLKDGKVISTKELATEVHQKLKKLLTDPMSVDDLYRFKKESEEYAKDSHYFSSNWPMLEVSLALCMRNEITESNSLMSMKKFSFPSNMTNLIKPVP